jgi:hypothetical protein
MTMKAHKNKPNWKSQPTSNEWNTNTNWDADIVPTDKAVFGESTQTRIAFATDGCAEIDSIEFIEEASPYTFEFGIADVQPALMISGEGIINRSGHTQNFIVASTGQSYKDPQLKFCKNASAGDSNNSYASGPDSLDNGYGGGIICFCDHATAGSALFTVRTGAMAPPKNKPSTVGGEVAFCDHSSAGRAQFTIYGSLGTDGDTFGNTVFHDHATADHGTFINIGGTVSGGDGGNTQFYNHSNAAHGVYHNQGGITAKANGGDVAFDGNADGGYGHFHNYVAKVAGAFGGVTSFNNNPPDMDSNGASAGHGFYHNYGATEASEGGGGHTEFTAKYGSPTGGHAHFINYGSILESNSSAGHTIFSINLPTKYFPTAGYATYYNHPALTKAGAAGYTEFSIWGNGQAGAHVPTGGNGIFINLGANVMEANGGYTSFGNTTDAGHARLLAHGGTHGGYGGRIAFYDQSTGGHSHIHLYGNGELDLSNHDGSLTADQLEISGGIISVGLGTRLATLHLTEKFILHSGKLTFNFRQEEGDGFKYNTRYLLLSAPGLSHHHADQFTGNSLDRVDPVFTIAGNELWVEFVEL